MNCPRCSTNLNEVTLPDLDETHVFLCPGCDGCWYPRKSLNEVAQAERDWLAGTEIADVLEADKLDAIDLDAPVSCPVCDEQMKRYEYALAPDVELDECVEHGIWLDDGELGVIMDKIAENRDLSEKARADVERVRKEMGIDDVAKGKGANVITYPFALTLRLLNKVFS
ncbi:MAG: zf-TFIIB domain-containing protein [Candidatus Eremiobacteraeota bacterium]|nr:zf-TFIIB domain-containing protein [Candidatus Eremiobacteraeota bacterium]